jgi:hypothetical protein
MYFRSATLNEAMGITLGNGGSTYLSDIQLGFPSGISLFPLSRVSRPFRILRFQRKRQGIPGNQIWLFLLNKHIKFRRLI